MPLLRRVTCPHCWTGFAPEEVLWVSAHADLRGDPRLGPEEPQRFLPTRFTVEGLAIDARGFPAHNLACPRCHLIVPRAMLEAEPFFVSILGTPGCGKSYFLATMTWELRRLLPQAFSLAFTDADPAANKYLNAYEEKLFLNENPNQWIRLLELVLKTDAEGGVWYQNVQFGSQSVRYPRPFLFLVQPTPSHPRAAKAAPRVICAYDNAGENFQVGKETPNSPVTQHMSQARLLLFLFDPTQDQRFQKLCGDRGMTGIKLGGGKPTRQETVLQEAASRVRRYRGTAPDARLDTLLIIVVTKYDAWKGLLEGLDPEPWNKSAGAALETPKIEGYSQRLRALLLQTCPEVVLAADSFVKTVLFLPSSALGRLPQPHPQDGVPAIQPSDLRPWGVTTPLLYALATRERGLIATTAKKQ